MDKTKIILIGSGSVKFTQGLLADLIKSSTPWKLGLVDTDPRVLETAEDLTRRMVKVKQPDVPDLSVEASTDRCDLLPGAHVVVTILLTVSYPGLICLLDTPNHYRSE